MAADPSEILGHTYITRRCHIQGANRQAMSV